jgi:hypothetical protein
MPMRDALLDDEDLEPHFHWRWNEHGIYLAVCTLIGAFVLMLQLLPTSNRERFDPSMFEMVRVHYLTSATEPAETDDPFHDPRPIRPPRGSVQWRLFRPAM